MIDKNKVFIGCWQGQHNDSTKFNPGCNACLSATLGNLIDILNAQDDDHGKPEKEDKPKKVK